MKIIVQDIKENAVSALRRCGYHFERQCPETDEISAARILDGAGGFPRLHAYAKMIGNSLQVNLHLDQKRPSYSGTKTHGGEYEGKIVEQEAERIKSILFNH